MSKHDDRSRLTHMLDHADEAVQMSAGRKRGDLDSDRQLNLSLVRLVEIIGEAATRVSAAMLAQTPSIPWVAIRAMRNRLIHGYDEVDFDVLWDVIQHDLPHLIAELRKAIAP